MFTRWKNIQKLPILLLSVIVLSTIISTLNPVVVQAASTGKLTMSNGAVIDTNRYGPILNHQLYFFLLGCFAQMKKISNNIDSGEYVSKYDFFQKSINQIGNSKESARGGMYNKDNPGCDEQQYIKEAVNALGWSDPADFICSLSFAYSTKYGGRGGKGSLGGDANKDTCLVGAREGDSINFAGREDSNFDWVGEVEKTLKTKPEGQKAVVALSPADEYIRAYRTLVKRCEVTLVKNFKEKSPVTTSGQVQLNIVNKDGSLDRWVASVKDLNKKVKYVATRTAGVAQEKTCNQLVALVMANSAKYAAYVNSTDDLKPVSNSGGDECRDGDENCDGEAATSCNINGIGWIVCPATQFLGQLNDYVYQAIKGFLEVKSTTDEQGRVAMEEAWKRFRDIANVLFAIAFLLIIYAQLTGRGSN